MAANHHDQTGAREMLTRLKEEGKELPRVVKVWADQGYDGDKLPQEFKEALGWDLEIVRRPQTEEGVSAKGFSVLPKRWVVEQTFGIFSLYRRLSKDYERSCEMQETMLYMAATNRLLQKLHKKEVSWKKKPKE